jgi:hypothetical protein
MLTPEGSTELADKLCRALRCQYLCFGTRKTSKLRASKASKLGLGTRRSSAELLRCQYLYFCTSKASKLGVPDAMRHAVVVSLMYIITYIY